MPTSTLLPVPVHSCMRSSFRVRLPLYIAWHTSSSCTTVLILFVRIHATLAMLLCNASACLVIIHLHHIAAQTLCCMVVVRLQRVCKQVSSLGVPWLRPCTPRQQHRLRPMPLGLQLPSSNKGLLVFTHSQCAHHACMCTSDGQPCMLLPLSGAGVPASLSMVNGCLYTLHGLQCLSYKV